MQPYGFASMGSLQSLDKRPLLFQSRTQGKTNDQEYSEWLDRSIGIVREAIWPEWSTTKGAGGWVSSRSASAREAQMEAITAADLDLMKTILAKKPLDNKLPASSSRTHLDLFLAEDSTAAFAVNPLGSYTSLLEPDRNNDRKADIANQMMMYFAFGIRWGAGRTALRMKHSLQRPRPYQMALIRNFSEEEFPVRPAKTASTPSAISGHCYQGMIGGAMLIQRLLTKSPEVQNRYMEPILKYTVDFGDRRVMAGLHYPSDNLASWITALRAVPHLYGEDPELMRQLWCAITEHSMVYKKLFPKDGDNSAGPFSAAWKELQDLKPAGT